MSRVVCEHCNESFSQKYGLNRHLGLIKNHGKFMVSCVGLDPSLKKKMISDYSHLLKEYNGTEDPTKIVAGTNKRLDWKCSICEHEWKSKGDNRVRGKGCAVCNNGYLHSDGRNSMANTHPELAKEYLGDATKITTGTHKKLGWKCFTCEHEWLARGYDRLREKGCPACAEHGFDTSKPANVYQIRFHTRQHGIFYKCGITNNEIHPRTIKIINNYKETYDDVIDVRINDEIYFEDGYDAWDFERKLKTSGTDLGSEFFSKKFDGFTETYAPSIIPIWNMLKAEHTDASNI